MIDMSKPIADMTGAKLCVGRFIAYPGLVGHSAIINFGMVRCLGIGGGKLGIYNENGTKTALMSPERCIALNDDQVPNGSFKDLLLTKRVVPIESITRDS